MRNRSNRTYATFAIYHDSLSPQAISDILELLPDRTQMTGDRLGPRINAEVTGWFLGTQGILDDDDFTIHIEWILNKLELKSASVKSLIDIGCRMAIFCFIEYPYLNAKPRLSHGLIVRASNWPIDLRFDIWCSYDQEG